MLRTACAQHILLLILSLAGPHVHCGNVLLEHHKFCFEDVDLLKHRGVSVAVEQLLRKRHTILPAAAHLHVDLEECSIIVAVAPAQLPPQHYSIVSSAGHLRLDGGDINGVIYGLLDLQEGNVRLGSVVGPAFETRIYSIEGQYLDLPDVAYYSSSPPYLNMSLLLLEMQAIERALPLLVQNKITALVILHPNVEDYITYTYLGNGTAVWGQHHPHWQRAAALCASIQQLVNATHEHGLKFYFKPYELGFPKQLQQIYPLGLHSISAIASTRQVIRAKYRELFERTGADGIVLTAEEVHPRGGYGSMPLAHDSASVAVLAEVFEDAVVTQCGKDLHMRLWRLTGFVQDFQHWVEHYMPPGQLFYSTKETDGDFFLRAPDNPLLTGVAPSLRNFTVELDVFRQYEGWGQMLIFMRSWGDRLSRYSAKGVRSVAFWGDWQGSSIWPDCQPGYLVTKHCPVSWRISQDRYYSTLDAFPRADERTMLQSNFTVPWRAGDITLALGTALAWDPTQNTTAFAYSYATKVFGAENAAAAVEALLCTEDAFKNRYLPPTKSARFGAYSAWTMIFQMGATQQAQIAEAAAVHGLETTLAVDEAAIHAAAKMLVAANRVIGTSQPNVEFRRAAKLTELFLRTNALFRSIYVVNLNISAVTVGQRKELCTSEMQPRIQALRGALEEWGSFPTEGADFNIVAPSPQLVGHHTAFIMPVSMDQYLNTSSGLINWVCDISNARSGPVERSAASMGLFV